MQFIQFTSKTGINRSNRSDRPVWRVLCSLFKDRLEFHSMQRGTPQPQPGVASAGTAV